MSDIMRKRILFLTIAFFTFILLTVICHYIFKPQKSVQKLSDNWTVTYNDIEYENVSLKDVRDIIGGMPQKGEDLSFTTTITPDESDLFPSIMYLSRYSAVEVFVNDELVHSSNMEKLDGNSFIGVHYTLITIEKQTDPFNLTIVYHVNEDNAYSDFAVPLYGDFRAVNAQFLFDNLFAMAAGIFLIIFGMAFFIITLVFYKTLPDILSQMFSSLLFVDLGIWILCYYRLLDLFMDTNGHMTEIEYVALYLMVPVIYMVIGCIQQHYKDWIFMIVAATSSTICLFLFVLHFSGIAHMNRTLMYYHLIAMLCVMFLAVTMGKDVYQKKILPAEAIQLIGIAFLLASFILNLAAYSLEMIGVIPTNSLTRLMIPMGGLIFVFATLINYFIYISESFARRKEYESLTHLAYADGLTNLPNRSRYEKYMSDLSNSKMDYLVVSLDLNGLKQINDNDGHTMGDRYLQEFGAILQQSFDGKAFLARIGGDEFVAIMTEDHWNEIDTILTRLNDALEVKNVLYPEYRRSVATGYAYSTEIPGSDSHAVYLLADKRMYESKKKMHKKMGIAARI